MKQRVSYRSLFGLSLMIFLIADVQGGVGPFLSIYLQSTLHWDVAKIGIALATVNFVTVVSQIPSGLLIDIIKAKRFLIAVATCIIILGCLLIIRSQTLLPILLAQSLIGVASSIIPPATAAITLGLVGRIYFAKRVSINGTFNHAGNVVTALVTGLMASWLGHAWILNVVVIFCILSLIPLFLINKSEINNDVARELPEAGSHNEPMPFMKILMCPQIIIFGLSSALFQFSNASQLPLLGQQLANQYPLKGSFFMASGIILAQGVMIVVAYSLGFIIDKVGRKPLFLLSFLVLIIRAFLYTITHKPYLLLSIQILDGIAAAISSIVSLVIISDLAKDSGRFNFTQGLIAFCIGIGAAMSNLVGGYIVNRLGFNMGFYCLGLIAAGGLLFFALLMPETKNRVFLTR